MNTVRYVNLSEFGYDKRYIIYVNYIVGAYRLAV